MQASYTVEGMTCGHCVAAVTEEVGQIPGVSDVSVTLEGGRLTVTSDAPVDFDRSRRSRRRGRRLQRRLIAGSAASSRRREPVTARVDLRPCCGWRSRRSPG